MLKLIFADGSFVNATSLNEASENEEGTLIRTLCITVDNGQYTIGDLEIMFGDASKLTPLVVTKVVDEVETEIFNSSDYTKLKSIYKNYFNEVSTINLR